MTELFAPDPSENLLPYDGIVNNFAIINNNSLELYAKLLNELNWYSDKVTMFGKTHITKRKIVWMGDIDAKSCLDYKYSGHTRRIEAWHPTVFHVKQIIEQHLLGQNIKASFNSCLLNYYPTGLEGMGYHADDEPELGIQPVIAALSLGATRKLVFKHKKTQHKVELNLNSGQLVVMRGETQRYWKHSITKTKKVTTGRISLTYRHILSN